MDNSVIRKTDKKELSKEEAVMLLYEAIDKIHRDSGIKGEYTLESIFYRLSEVQNKYIVPKMLAQSGQAHTDTIARIHAVIDPFLIKEVAEA